jgi:hypothetical protein
LQNTVPVVIGPGVQYVRPAQIRGGLEMQLGLSAKPNQIHAMWPDILHDCSSHIGTCNDSAQVQC